MSFFKNYVRGSMSATMWTGNMIYTAIQKAKTKRDINAIYTHASEANFQNRSVAITPNINKQQLMLVTNDPNDNDVYDFKANSISPTLDYIITGYNNTEITIISGGENKNRVKALVPYVRISQNSGTSVIAIHSGNRMLETMLEDESLNHEIISRDNVYYDPFRGLPVDEIVYLLYEIMQIEDANPAVEALLRSLSEMVVRIEGAINIQNMAKFPLIDLKEKLDMMLKSKEVTIEEYQYIYQNYLSGSSETDRVRVFLNRLSRQLEGVYGKPKLNTSNIKKMLNFNGVVSIDVGNSSNELLISLIVQYILSLQTQGRKFALIIDDLPISRFPKLMDLFRGCVYAVSHNDFISSLYGGEKRGEDIFAEISGSIGTCILFKHMSGTSCQKWSEHIGKYHKIRIKYNISQSSAFMNSSDQRGISIDESEEPRVRAETLSKLTGSLACIHNGEGTLFAEF